MSRAYDQQSTAALRQLAECGVEAARSVVAEREAEDTRETLVPLLITCEPIAPTVALRTLPTLVGLPLATLHDLARGGDDVASVAREVIAERLAGAWRRAS